MKKCSECGYANNADHASVCEKCRTPLTDSSPSTFTPDNSGNPTGKKTMKGAVPNMPYWDDNSLHIQSEEALFCEKCNYPMSSLTTSCARCGHSPQTPQKNVRDFTKKETGIEDTESLQNPISPPPQKKHTMKIGDFSPFEDTSHGFKLISEKDKKELSFTGTEVSLNRDNLDSSNPTISGNIHANLQFIDGKWYLSDLSSNQATFIQVKDKSEITNDTLIIIGNKVFRFMLNK